MTGSQAMEVLRRHGIKLKSFDLDTARQIAEVILKLEATKP